MVDTRRGKRKSNRDDNGYGDVPPGAVGVRGEGREYPGGYGSEASEFAGGVIDTAHGGPPDDEGFAAPTDQRRSGLGAFGDRDPRDVEVSRRRGEAERPSSYRGRGPRGYRRSDTRIFEDVCEWLTEDRFIDASQVEVVVKGGEVTLSGLVATRGLKRRAEDLAHLVPGVRNVQNNLRIDDRP